MILEELAPNVSLDEVRASTEATFTVSPTLKEYDIEI